MFTIYRPLSFLSITMSQRSPTPSAVSPSRHSVPLQCPVPCDRPRPTNHRFVAWLLAGEGESGGEVHEELSTAELRTGTQTLDWGGGSGEEGRLLRLNGEKRSVSHGRHDGRL